MDFKTTSTPPGVLESLFNHIALPVKLPQESDSSIDEIERALVDRLTVAANLMRDAQDPAYWRIWDSLRRSLQICKALNIGGKLERSQLSIHLKQLRDSDVIILHVAAQNAGIIIHKPIDPKLRGNILFETFEASPKRESVLASQTLSWTFPGTAVLVPSSTFYDDAFIDSLSVFLEQASVESTQKFSEYATKSGHQVTENRENADPALITSFLTAVLEANGKRISPTLLQKRVRDDICWSSNAPWRRLPYWLVLRVGIARYLATILGGPHGRIQYKFWMCIIHGIILDDIEDIVPLEDQSFLKAKLCRRLYKLDRDCLEQPQIIQEVYGKLNRVFTPLFKKTLEAVDFRINEVWTQQKKGMIRPIPPLPRQANPKELCLSLFSSREYLNNARKRFQNTIPYRTAQPLTTPHQPKVHIQATSNKLLKLFEKEKQIRYTVSDLSLGSISLSARVQQLHGVIHDYIGQINGQYDDNVEQKSIMLLTLMETWTALDDAACKMFPLLYEFHPVFTARLLEILRLPLLSDISRARKVESYIRGRISRSGDCRATLFDDPCKGCFAERYFDGSSGSSPLANILAEIQSTSAQQLKEKEQEWREMSAEYEMLTREYDSATCVYVQSMDGLYPTHDQYTCPKCQLDKRRSRMTIRAFESPLPENTVMAKAIVFELRCPEALASYRDATWAILHGVAKPSQEVGIKPRICLQDYSGLKMYARVPGSISLASTTKSFLMTHYRGKKFPVDLDQVCYPNGLKLSYFDQAFKSWPGHRPARPTFEHHCKLSLPKSSPFSNLLESQSFNAYGDGPSSYEIAASHSHCPSSLNPHEYTAFQYLLSGKRRRWITILRELGSSNLNLSTETTTMLLDHLAHQIGPSDEHHELLGAIHYVFEDISFCEALLHQLKTKLEAIASNWRETHLMEIVVILTLRLIAFTAPSTNHLTIKSLDLLSEARQITLQWVRMLRKEMYSTGDLDNKRNCQSYLLWAALLCKRTYASHQIEINQYLKEEDISIFIECSATVYDNIPDNIASLGQIMKNSFIRDLRMMYDLKDKIRQWIERHSGGPLHAALRNLWPAAASKSLFAITFENDGWIQISLNDVIEGLGSASYNYIFGILLVDGEPLGKLPTDPKSTIILEELFGSQTSLMKYPSTSPGMTHVLAFEREGYETHIGYDGAETIIRAIKENRVLELIPREKFRNGNQFDLPAHLIDNCIHWLDPVTGILEIRSKTKNIWKSHPHNWRLDVTTSTCSRFTPGAKGKETLVDPYSPLFNRVSRIFAYFEHPMHLTIYQPGGKFSPTVEMPRMQLRWFVNRNKLLQSSHLQAEIDPSQCIDTWYGFDSKLVCRSLKNPQDRFVLAPLGLLRARKRGCHVQVIVQIPHPQTPSANYIRFMVNTTLGRIDCASEPALVYKKAEIHALTSFILPDPLTGLTGIESSLSILTSGISQPWAPLTVLPTNILCALSRLSPKREYYPEDLKVMKKEIWNHDLPTLVQREEFHILADKIISQSDRLDAFHPQKMETEKLSSSSDTHLDLRALRRRQHYERCSYGLSLDTPDDTVYESRHDPRASSSRYSNVLETAVLIRNKPRFMSTVRDLAVNLSQSLVIKGYNQDFDKITLHDRLEVDIRREFGPLVNAVKDIQGRFKLMFFLGVISFRSNANMHLIRTLIAFAHWDDLQSLSLPPYDEYCSFRPHQVPQIDVLVKLIEPFQAPPPEDPPLMEFASGRNQRKVYQAKAAHAQKASSDCKKLAQALIHEWPTPNLNAKHTEDSYLIDVPAALNHVRPEWERTYRNHEFYIHLQAVQEILNQRHSDIEFQRPDFVPSELMFNIQQPDYRLPTLSHDMMGMPIHKVRANITKQRINPGGDAPQPRLPFRNSSTEKASSELAQIIDGFSQSKSAIKKRYAADLKESLAAFRIHSSQAAAVSALPSSNDYTVNQLEAFVKSILAEIESAVEQPNVVYSARQILWLQYGQLWPAITRITLLEQLRATTKRSFGTGMKGRLLDFALSITSLQRQLRMQSYQNSNEHARYEEERINTGHSNWRPEDYPDWILLEVESNLLIRETQVEVALAIIDPESKANSVLQLNMGQGKTSCIIPMAAVLLADGKNLVRVSVPKALLKTTAQLLHGRLGGLVGREISHVPFSRRTSTKEGHIKLFHRLHRDIQRKHGIMLCLPEHQMSFMLSGLQRVLDQEIPEANMMVRVQGWIQSCARDILDESDHTLAVKTQLIYPSGSQMTVDGHPHRWVVVEQILGLMDMHLYELATSYRYSIEVVRRPHGGFPFVFFLRPDVEEELVIRLRYDVCRGARGIIPIDSIEPADRIAIKEFLSSGKVRQASLDRISRLCPDRPHIRQTIYLLRGLFVHRILIMSLKKRYGVQYGLHPLRDPVAVPFHAKGVPSDQSEFGHVDVAILLTALAFYYCGISISQTRQALEAVLKSDDPASEYDKWTEDEDFPDYLRDWHSINVDDSQQMGQIWNSVRFKVPVIDYFMNNFVFPPHAKQFKVRLQSNGWDIPLPSHTQSSQPNKNKSLNQSRGLTTGFSGTNDIKPLLPLTIKQDDLPALSHTNAEVLTYLLQPRSKSYSVMVDQNQKRISEISFLHMLRRRDIRILIDSGAQILEQSNKELAENWLKVDGRAVVALYFEGDSPWILSKQGTKTPLLASPYADNLNEVLVYLDEAHTRGTDLKFGQYARAALTLGLSQTKDHTVQAAMRLRQLGTTQSVAFFAPPEVNQSIRDLCGKVDSEWINSYDVIRWLISNTCDGIEQLQPLYYSQGTDYCNRMQAAEDFPNFLVDDDHRAAFINAIKHKERQTLQQLYGPQSRAKVDASAKTNPKIAGFAKELESRKKNFQDTGQAVHASALQEVEQEREMENEVEAVRQVKKPLPYTPHKFPGLHRDLETFARTGRIPAGSDHFIHILRALARTALGRKYKVNYDISSSQLFISSEFERTVKLIIESANDNFMRPVQWILHTGSPEAAIVVTPEEAEHLIQIIQETERGGQISPTRLLTYAAPVTRRMMHFNKLSFYSMPPISGDWQPSEWLATELGFFAGRLYFDWSEYHSICNMLGIDLSTPGMDEFDSSEMDTDQQTASGEVSSDPDGSQRVASNPRPNSIPTGQKLKGLTSKPYTFTQEYLAVRRRGQDFTHTPMGFLCNGKPLSEDSPFFRRADAVRRRKGLVPVGITQADNTEEGGEEAMDLGNYDPSAEIQDDEDQITIEYDESDMHRMEEEDTDKSSTEAPSPSSIRGKRSARRKGR
ncbi:uncharacterized protein GGS22DRAFT_84023 [Annulohypoxylon maeteangense]|uniref:uncharacterized protein n=1 Tax=Annulohypoxylon maeteangense TaxID=1927788 RepID=UPI002008A3A2|nr:uncharacterized protein GGS22DRAFT_84023 [Annulohypoxylon maeteangense]KAI0880451.1 hypothetical protein GGS22DRAFT_84023 [Annulohypoxylon maeteangense]